MSSSSRTARRARPLSAGWILAALVVAGPAAAQSVPDAGAEQAPRVAVRLLPEGDVPEADLANRFAEAARVPSVRFIAAALPEPALPPEFIALEERARALELELRFRDAALVWREVVERLAAGPALVLAPRQVSRAQVALAAAYAEAGEPDLALAQFRAALALDAAFAPGPEYAPPLRALHARARAAGPALPPTPDDPVLDAAAEALGADAILWAAAGNEAGRRVLVRRLHFAGEPSREIRAMLPEDAEAAARAVEREAAEVRGALATRFPAPAPPPAASTARPWYRSPWLPAGVAVVAAGALGAVALGYALGDDRVDVTVRH